MMWREPTFDLSKLDPPLFSDQWDGIYTPIRCMVDYRIAINEGAGVSAYQGVQLHNIDIFRYEGSGIHKGDRKTQHIVEDKISDYLISIPVTAHISIEQDGRKCDCHPGEFSIVSTSKPFKASVTSTTASETFSAIHVRISGNILRSRIPYIDDCCARPMANEHGSGAIMKKMCELALEESHNLSPAQANRFGDMLINAVASASEEIPEVFTLPIHSASKAHISVWNEARAFIELHLSENILDTESVAKHCRVSKRYIQSVFSEFSTTVTAVVREARLKKCQEDLRNNALRHLQVSQIAMLWGFNDIPYFCRTYKNHFGVSPGKDRNEKKNCSTIKPSTLDPT